MIEFRTITLSIRGVLLTLDGFVNFVYWRKLEHKHKLFFQIGRLVRGMAGLLFTISMWWGNC